MLKLAESTATGLTLFFRRTKWEFLFVCWVPEDESFMKVKCQMLKDFATTRVSSQVTHQFDSSSHLLFIILLTLYYIIITLYYHFWLPFGQQVKSDDVTLFKCSLYKRGTNVTSDFHVNLAKIYSGPWINCVLFTCVKARRSNCNVIESNISVGALFPHSCHLNTEPAEKHITNACLEHCS